MTEGYWINYSTGKMIEMPEHESFIRDPKNAKKLGVPPNVHTMAANIKDREKYLVFLLQHAPLMRVRGHGASVGFQFATHNRQDAMDAILAWGRDNAGPMTWLMIDNFATKESTQMNFEQFEQTMTDNGAEGVLRVAGATQKIKISAKIISELLAVSRKILDKS